MKDHILGTSHITANFVASVLAKQIICVAIIEHIQEKNFLNASNARSVLVMLGFSKGMKKYTEKRSQVNVIFVENVLLA